MSHLSAAQVEQLKLIGAELSEHRQKVKMSLDEVSSKTYIPLRILLAVERAQADSLPEPVFVQGFIRRYGDAIGVNGKLLSDRLVLGPQSFEIKTAGSLSDLPTPKGFGKGESQNGAATRATRTIYAHHAAPPPPTAAATTTKLKPFTRKQVTIPWKYGLPAVAGLGIVAAIAGLGPMLVAQLQQATTPSKPNVTQSKAAVKPPYRAVPAKAVKAVVNITNDAWIRVTVDGKPTYTANAVRGFQQTWNAKQNIVIETGNAGAVMVALNNQKFQALGQSGEVKAVKISANGIRTQ